MTDTENITNNIPTWLLPETITPKEGQYLKTEIVEFINGIPVQYYSLHNPDDEENKKFSPPPFKKLDLNQYLPSFWVTPEIVIPKEGQYLKTKFVSFLNGFPVHYFTLHSPGDDEK